MAWARTAYGVCFKAHAKPLTVDDDATRELRSQRLVEVQASSGAQGGRALSEGLLLSGCGAGGSFHCARCGGGLGAADSNYKLSTRIDQTPITKANPHIQHATLRVDAALVLRRYHCPGCGLILDTEVALSDDAPLWDIELQ